MNVEQIAHILHGEKCGSSWLCRCPVPGHGRGEGDRHPSLKISADVRKIDGLDLFCFAGCRWQDVKAELRLRGLVADTGWRIGATESLRPASLPTGPAQSHERIDDGTARRRAAIEIWRRASHWSAQPYFEARGIRVTIPPTVRWHPSLVHRPTGHSFESVVAAVQAPTESICAVQRIYLAPGGRAKAAIKNAKMTLGNIGDGAVRLAPVSTILGLGEGVETSLSAMQMFGVPCWAVLGRRFANVALPEMVREVLIFADHDNPGIEAALRARDAFQCQGRKVTIHLPAFGNDFNDDLTALSRHAR